MAGLKGTCPLTTNGVNLMSLSNHISIENLKKWKHHFTTEQVTDATEFAFNEWIKDYEFNIYHQSGDINVEELNHLFNCFMKVEEQFEAFMSYSGN
tara:strand:+ start:373 stop:660 length:288 start_codon:yes stop_codon:yes gene_type:complete